MDTILIIDDQEVSRLILGEFVTQIGPSVRGKVFSETFDALKWVRDHAVVMVIVDFSMPGMDGIEFTKRFHTLSHCKDVPVVMISVLDDKDKAIKYRALEAGVFDFLHKPIDYTELKARCRQILELRKRYQQNQHHDDIAGVLFRITQSFNGRDPWRLADISRQIARQLGLSIEACNMIEQAAPLNDLGHMFATNRALSQPAVLHRSERVAMQQHTVKGYQLLNKGGSGFLCHAAKIALSHHERFDGKGYPHGFKGRDIAREARIVAVADIVDALLSDRPYRKAWSHERTLDYLRSERGKRFDPDCVDAFMQQSDEILFSESGKHSELRYG